MLHEVNFYNLPQLHYVGSGMGLSTSLRSLNFDNVPKLENFQHRIRQSTEVTCGDNVHDNVRKLLIRAEKDRAKQAGEDLK